jgi:hypothetical protein
MPTVALFVPDQLSLYSFQINYRFIRSRSTIALFVPDQLSFIRAGSLEHGFARYQTNQRRHADMVGALADFSFITDALNNFRSCKQLAQ